MKLKLFFLLTLLNLFTPIGRSAEVTTNVTLVGQLDPLEEAYRYGDVWGEGNLACLGCYNRTGVAIIDIANPALPRLLSHYNPPGESGRMEDCQIVNRIGYFASNHTNGVHIVNLTNPASPVLLSRINREMNGYDHVHNLFVHGDYLYLTDAQTTVVKVF